MSPTKKTKKKVKVVPKIKVKLQNRVHDKHLYLNWSYSIPIAELPKLVAFLEQFKK